MYPGMPIHNLSNVRTIILDMYLYVYYLTQGQIGPDGNINSASLTISNTASSQAGRYRCVASNSLGSTEGPPISLVVIGGKCVM